MLSSRGVQRRAGPFQEELPEGEEESEQVDRGLLFPRGKSDQPPEVFAQRPFHGFKVNDGVGELGEESIRG
jgi:hypothetical protein